MSTPQAALLTPEKQEWLSALIGMQPPSKPDDPLKNVKVDEIRGALSFTMEKMPQGLLDHLKKAAGMDLTMKSLDKKGDAMKEIDTEEDLKKLKALEGDSMKKAVAAMEEIGKIGRDALKAKYKAAGISEQQVEKMQAALKVFEEDGRCPPDGPTEKEIKEFQEVSEKLEAEVSEEVYTPLVRQGAMPENLVPDRFSEMKRTFKGASKAYEERLAKYKEENGKNANLLRKLGVSQDIIDKASVVGAAAMKMLPPGAGEVMEANVTLAMELLPLASGLFIETTEQIIQKKDPQDIVNGMLSGVSSICAKAIPDKEVAAMVTGSIATVIAGGKMARAIKDKDPDAAFGALADAANSALATAGTATGTDALKKAPLLIKAFKTCAEGVAYEKALHEKPVDEKKVKKALAELVAASIDTIGEAVQQTIDAEVSDEDESDEAKELVEKATDALIDKEKEELEDEGDEAEGVSDEDKKNLLELKNIILAQNAILKNRKASKGEKRKACEEKAKAQLALRENRQMLRKLAEADDADFLNMSESDLDDTDDDTMPPAKLQELILKLEKDQKIFKLVNTLSSLPLQVAAEFFPPAATALNFKQFCVETMIAVKHARSLLEWQVNAKNARAGASPQVHAMLSRVGMAERRATEHSINAALYLTAGLGNIITTVGAHGAPVGVAMTSAAKLGLATAALAKVAIDEVEMENGWRLFQKALKNPANRKAARRAIEENPTLAKYSIAWGALKGNDAFAKSALKKCGVTAAVLETEGANVSEVQRFLETMFDEDLVILRAVPDEQAWYPAKKPVFTFVSWTAFLGAATTKAKPALAAGSGGAVSEAFVNFNAAEQKFKAARKTFEKAQELKDKLFAAELEKLKPKATSGQPKPKTVALTNMAEVEKGAVENSKLEGARKDLVDSEEEMRAAVEAIQSAAQGFLPINATDKQPHVQMKEYLKAVVALGDLKIRELDGATVALDSTDEAELQDPAQEEAEDEEDEAA